VGCRLFAQVRLWWGFQLRTRGSIFQLGGGTKNRRFRRVIPDTLPQCSLLKKEEIRIRIGAGNAISRTPFFARNWKRAETARGTELYVGRRDQGDFVQCGCGCGPVGMLEIWGAYVVLVWGLWAVECKGTAWSSRFRLGAVCLSSRLVWSCSTRTPQSSRMLPAVARITRQDYAPQSASLHHSPMRFPIRSWRRR
jgi:hypothetical protein